MVTADDDIRALMKELVEDVAVPTCFAGGVRTRARAIRQRRSVTAALISVLAAGCLLFVGGFVVRTSDSGNVAVVDPANTAASTGVDDQRAQLGLRLLGSTFALKQVQEVHLSKSGTPSRDTVANYRSADGSVQISWQSMVPATAPLNGAAANYTQTSNAEGGIVGIAIQGERHVIVKDVARAPSTRLPLSRASLRELALRLLQASSWPSH